MARRSLKNEEYLMIEWLSQNLTGVAAVVVSLGTLVFTNVQKDATTTGQVLTKVDVLEKQVQIIPMMNNRIANLETSNAVTNQILIELNGNVLELSTNTKELSNLITTVAVLDEKVNALESNRSNK